jgi:tetratricopeptide (TPR) repeat protein
MVRTRRILLPLAMACSLAGCATGTPSAMPTGASPLTTPVSNRAPSAAPTDDPARPSASPPGSAGPAAYSPTVDTIARLEAEIATDPSDATKQRDLGFALLQRIRETADPTLYAPAERAFDLARGLDPGDALTLVGIGGLQLGKHQFAAALASGQKAVAMSPRLDTAHAVVVDALVELGRYDEAQAAADEMLGLTLDLTTLTRASYLAELHGHLPAALSAMRMAAKAPSLAPENIAFVDAQIGNLLVYTGDPVAAADAYRAALTLVPAHAPSVAGEARLAVGAGRLDDAIALFGRAADIVPLPEYVIALGEAQMAAGHADDATRSFKVARAEIQLFKSTGVVVDLDLALFEADHGDPAQALAFARTARAATPTVRADDALGWALHRLGRDEEAKRWSDEALRLGSRDPLFRYHAGAIAAALGNGPEARTDLQLALSTDPGFSPTGAAEARRILAGLP